MDYKKGAPPDVPEGAWLPFFSPCIPPPLENSPKCPRCSLVSICLPDEVNFLRGSTLPTEPRMLVPPAADATPLYVQEQGAKVGVSGQVLEVRVEGEVAGKVRLIDVAQVCLVGNVQIAAQAIRVLAERGIPVCHMSTGWWFSAITTGLFHKNVEHRRAQYRAAFEPSRCVALARRFVEAKILNQRTLLRRNHPSPPQDVLLEMKRLATAAARSDQIATLLGLEGLAARLYFGHLGEMLKPADLGFDFDGRNRRPPRDPVNALLSYAYSLLTKDFTVACQAVGLDPYQGFYHAIRYGRPSLALDLMEEFRPLVADSTVLTVLNRGWLRADDFEARSYGVSLKPEAKRKFLRAYETRMQDLVTHPVFNYRISYRQVLTVQARLLARHLAGEIDDYPSFLTR